MPAHRVQIELQLGAGDPVDVLILQWHTPVLANGGKIPAPIAACKLLVLEQLRNWLVQDFEGRVPHRPLFVLLPELSTPSDCDDMLRTIVAGMHRPTVLIAGLEFLLWEEYRAIVQQLPHMPGGPNSWLHGGQADRIVNAAVIWVRENTGQVTKYIQPKRHPSDTELPIMYLGENVLLFCSSNQAPGHRFNFCAQICSDFLAPGNVTQLRRELLQAVNNVPLPLEAVFILQCQGDPNAVQFSQGTAAYFVPGADLMVTAEGCAVFVNNASPKHGRSQVWGQSQLRFRYNSKWPTLAFPSPTFYLLDNGVHDHQAVILREPGPGLYQLAYKPAYLVNRLAGPAGQHVPFPDEHAYWSPIVGNGFHTQFTRIPAICHWLKAEWLEGCADLVAEFHAGHLTHVASSAYLPAHGRCIHSWNTLVGDNEPQARAATDLYFYCWRDHSDYPSKCREPKRWRPHAASHGAKRMMKACALLGLAVHAHMHDQIAWAPAETIHAVVNGRMTIAFLWGAGTQSATAMITQYRDLQDNCGLATLLTPVSLVVLVDPFGPIPINYQEQQITTAPSLGNEQHLQQQGDVVAAAYAHRQVYLNDNDLYGPLYNAATPGELHGALVQILTDKGL